MSHVSCALLRSFGGLSPCCVCVCVIICVVCVRRLLLHVFGACIVLLVLCCVCCAVRVMCICVVRVFPICHPDIYTVRMDSAFGPSVPKNRPSEADKDTSIIDVIDRYQMGERRRGNHVS